jgi:hypothetical protein
MIQVRAIGLAVVLVFTGLVACQGTAPAPDAALTSDKTVVDPATTSLPSSSEFPNQLGAAEPAFCITYNSCRSNPRGCCYGSTTRGCSGGTGRCCLGSGAGTSGGENCCSGGAHYVGSLLLCT